jgi:L-aspartate oxidase
VFAELSAGRGALLDARKAIGDSFEQRFPSVHASCKGAGIDPARELIPVAPAAHYHMGGVLVDATGRTTLDGLWAAGEVASTGAHGANRLASNSLLEAIVYGARIAEDIAGLVPMPQTLAWPDERHRGDETVATPEPTRERELRQLMSAHVGVIRDREGLIKALDTIQRMERESRNVPAMRNMATAALLVTAAALGREESRGGHYRSDFPETNPALAKRTFITLAEAQEIAHRATTPEAVA